MRHYNGPPVPTLITMKELIAAIIDMTLLAAPWLLLGLVVAGLVRGLVPRARIQQWLSGGGIRPILRGAVLGVPLPMCSCGAIPTALALYRGGAGRGPTTSFLVGTPGAGIDSLSLTFVLMGPFMMVARALGALVAAVSTGLLTALSQGGATARQANENKGDCCSSGCSSGNVMADADETAPGVRHGLRYAFTEMLDDISVWIAIGLGVAGLLITLTPPQGMAVLGGGVGPMLLMALIGVPLYLCAAATTPIAAALMLEGLSPGTALVLMLAGPVTSLATLSIFQREMGTSALLLYLAGIVLSTVAAGLVTDSVIAGLGLDIQGSVQEIQQWIPIWLEWGALILLVVMALPWLRRMLIKETHDD
ncbi:SO_0444 family Cu/Zn efflux transporter [Halomonadaceae bacterium KBTZ08]